MAPCEKLDFDEVLFSVALELCVALLAPDVAGVGVEKTDPDVKLEPELEPDKELEPDAELDARVVAAGDELPPAAEVAAPTPPVPVTWLN